MKCNCGRHMTHTSADCFVCTACGNEDIIPVSVGETDFVGFEDVEPGVFDIDFGTKLEDAFAMCNDDPVDVIGVNIEML